MVLRELGESPRHLVQRLEHFGPVDTLETAYQWLITLHSIYKLLGLEVEAFIRSPDLYGKPLMVLSDEKCMVDVANL